MNYLLSWETMFGGFLWIIPLGLIGLIGLCIYKVKKARASGTKQQIPGGGWEYTNEKPKYFTIPSFIFGLILFVVLIAFIVIQLNEK